MDRNKNGTYKNRTATTERKMLAAIKDFLALVAISGFATVSLTWLDLAHRLA
jgi:hypothetical protein